MEPVRGRSIKGPLKKRVGSEMMIKSTLSTERVMERLLTAVRSPRGVLNKWLPPSLRLLCRTGQDMNNWPGKINIHI